MENVGRNFYQIINMKTERFPSKILIWPAIGLALGIIMSYLMYYIDIQKLYYTKPYSSIIDILAKLNNPAFILTYLLSARTQLEEFYNLFYPMIVFQWVFIGSLISIYILDRKYRRERKR